MLPDDDAVARDLMKRLIEYRRKAGIKQTEVAEKMNVGQPSVSELERSNASPMLSTLTRYAKAVGLSVDVTISFPEDGSSEREAVPFDYASQQI